MFPLLILLKEVDVGRIQSNVVVITCNASIKTFDDSSITEHKCISIPYNTNVTSCFHHNACLTLLRTFMEYFVLSPNDQESLNKFLSSDSDPDPDHLRGPSQGHNTYCVKKSNQSEQLVFSYASGRTNRQTKMHNSQTPLPGARVKTVDMKYIVHGSKNLLDSNQCTSFSYSYISQ